MTNKKMGIYSGEVDLSGDGTLVIGDVSIVEEAVAETSNSSVVAKVTNVSGNTVTIDAYELDAGAEDTSTTDLSVKVSYVGS